MTSALPVRISPAARADQVRLAAFLAERRPEAATRAVNLLREAFRRLSRHPALGRPVGNARRELSLRFGGGGYVIQYRVDPDAVIVVRVFHSRERRPRF